MKLTDKDIDDGLRLCEAATPGPWEVRYRELDNHEQAKIWTEPYGWLITKGELPRAMHEPSMEHIAFNASPERVKLVYETILRQRKLLTDAHRFILEGKRKFAPNTTNSFVDDWLADYAKYFGGAE